MSYLPIEDYAIIGDMHTAALIGTNGSIDWLCLPHFDSPSVFAAILDDKKGGSFGIYPDAEEVTEKHLYWPDTNVLVTRFLTDHGAAELVDFMPVGEARRHADNREIIRRVTAVRGDITFQMKCRPAFDYARASHDITLVEGGACFHSAGSTLALATDVPVQRRDDAVVAEFSLHEGQCAVFVLRYGEQTSGCGPRMSEEDAETSFRQTVAYWQRWLSQCQYEGRWREMVRRSALALKLLTFEPTGAIIASPTTSLPEEIGGERNWDYRFTWIRDAAFTMYALLRLGFAEEAGAYIDFLQSVCKRPGAKGPLQLMYGIDGRRDLEETTLTHLSGYCNSQPVRIGNGAFDQLQLDIYGELIDSIYLYNKYGAPIDYDTWSWVTTFAEWVIDNWQREDESIWEVRGGRSHFVYSKLMCWVALDRTIRLAWKRSLPGDVDRWTKVRDAIYAEIMEKGWNEERQAFVQSYGSDHLDASNLMMPLVLFSSPVDRRFLKTLDATMTSPHNGGLLANHLVFRYDTAQFPDGVSGHEGTFNICTFWLVEALTRAGQYRPEYLSQARLIFERMLGFSNPVGLFAEETGWRGEALGNFPQAFTHLSLISAAFSLDRALDAR
ncbi:MAG: glycoside hydrolase family 15 protein [candidate division Zixibacteria bacterium]|nr:glycoside hydrolase family 15 protein [candidate division Zixibacteria bacterium]